MKAIRSLVISTKEHYSQRIEKVLRRWLALPYALVLSAARRLVLLFTSPTIVTLVERTTREVKLKALKHRKAEQVAQACIEILNAEKVCTITFDNGKEFSRHEQIAEELNAEIFFARPYHSWERGSNENLNGLIRQFLPKSVRLDNLCAEYIKEIEDNLNNRPRKVLGFMTPLEVKVSFGCVAIILEPALYE